MTGNPEHDGPYLTVVTTSRNDTHGGDPRARLQGFVNAFDAQCRRTALDAEVIVVEWNPPADRPRLREVIRVPDGCAFMLRFVEVPPELHATLAFADALPLFQMIAKNVGIRRARGQFILSTNIDIVFSTELVEFLASGRLRPGFMYRTDRHDIESAFPVDTSLDEQMAYCAGHHLRVNARNGTYPVDRFGDAAPLDQDVVERPAVDLGDGWHVREGDAVSGFYRWACDVARLKVERTTTPELATDAVLALDLEPNPYDPAAWVDVEILEGDRRLTRRRLTRRTTLHVALDDHVPRHEVTLRLMDASATTAASMPIFEQRDRLRYRLKSARVQVVPARSRCVYACPIERWRRVDSRSELAVEAIPEGLLVRSDPARYSYCVSYRRLQAPTDGVYSFALDYRPAEGDLFFGLLDESRDGWDYGEAMLIDRGDERTSLLSVRMKRGRRFALYITNHRPEGDGVSRFVVHRLRASVPPDVLEPTLTFSAMVDAVRGTLARVRALARARFARLMRRIIDSDIAVRARRRIALPPLTPGSAPGGYTPAADVLALAPVLQQHRPPSLHQNACGDFQLMAREHWFDIRGYPELQMYSMNIDGLLGTIAHYAGVREQRLEMPICVYHLEHERGSGWTPEGEALLRRRIAERGITWLDYGVVCIWGAYMEWLQRPMIFNTPDWGFAGAALPETTFQPASERV
jgi:hypothetical protein